MNIVYRDSYLNLITQEESELVSSWVKDYEFDDLLKIRETYSFDELQEIIYYKFDKEANQQILEKYAAFYYLKKLSIREWEPDYGSYKIDKEINFRKDNLTNLFELEPYIYRNIYSSIGDMSIATETINTSLPESDPNYKKVSKIYYFGCLNEFPEGSRPYILPCYDENGDVECIEYDPNPSSFESQDIQKFDLERAKNWMKELGFPKKMQNWYLNKDFLPPL